MSTILVIDDEPLVRRVLVRLLHSAGHETAEAGDGVEGLRVYDVVQPDLVITDLVMPEKEGLETIADLREQNPDLPVIAMTGVMPRNFLDFARDFGAVTTLVKPFTRDEVLAAVNQALDLNGAD